MSQDGNERQTAKEDTAGGGDRTGASACPVIVVGIGASAGGLRSLTRIFAKMPPGHRVAFVLIQHPEESHENQTARLLQEQTALAVVEATDGMPVLADRIHVMRPDKFLNISGSRLTLHEPVSCNGRWMPVDHFFCSLAADQRHRACGIVLSGTGSDGTLGLSEIKAVGGRVFLEDPGSAGFANVPPAAIDEGMADAVLPAEGMAAAIIAMAEQVIADTCRNPTESPEFDANLRQILDILHAKVGHDFRCYKPSTVVRRIRRRMTLTRMETFADYARFFREHPEEAGLLQKDLLIGVTEFFRQPQAWENLEEKVISSLVENAGAGSEIRVWVPGCSTGQEAYSLAMLIAEQVERSGKKVGIHIFATDSDTASLARARSGSYSEEEIGKNVSPERRERFFTFRDGRYQVIKEIRKGVLFAPQNLTVDPPFSRLDLISCRNLFIYLDQQVQQKIVALFHFALREGGFLFLGTAEAITEREDLFEAVSKQWRIYRRIGVGRPVGVEVPVRPIGAPPAADFDEFTRVAEKLPVATSYGKSGLSIGSRVSLASAVQALLLARFAPACVMINRKLEVLYVHGEVENYLTFPTGELTTRVGDMAREGLRARLGGAISRCLEAGKSVSVTARVRRGEKSAPVKATVSPLRYPREVDGLLLITFEDYRVPVAKSRRQAAGERDVHQLQDELKVTREELQSTIDQLENSNDQLKASHEEVTAANEELQSANEELETSKEELQALNEELNTINSRLQEKVEELESTNNDVVNLLSSTNIATVFLDKDLRIRRYTPAITRLLSLIPSDVGRPMADVLHRFSDEALLADAARVLADLTPLATEVQAEDGRWYIRRITPYRTQDDRIEGVVLTFVDVSDLKRAEQAVRESENKLRIVADFTYDWEYWRGPDDSFLYVSPSCKRVTGYTREEFMEDPRLYSRIIHPEDRERVGAHLREDQCHREPCELEFRIVRRDDQERWIAHACQAVLDAHGQSLGRRSSNRDITERKQAEEEVARVASFPLLNPQPVVEADLDGRVWFTNPAAERLFPDLEQRGHEHPWFVDWEAVADACREGCDELPGREVTVDGRWYHQAMYFVPETGRIRIYGLDITQRKEAEEALRQLNAELEQRVVEQTAEIRRTYEAVEIERQRFNDVLEMLPVYVVLLTPDYHVPFANRFFRERFGESDGQRCFEYLFGRTEPCEVCETYKVLKTNAPHRWEWTGPDGHNYDIYDFPFTDTDGSPLIMEMGIDVTELKQAEKSLKEANETLERRVAERTAELAAARNEAVSEKNRLEAVMEALPVGVAIVDARGGNVRSNDMFEKAWGSPRPSTREVGDYKAYRAWWADTGRPVEPEEWGSARAVQKDETVIGQMIEIESFDGARKYIMNSAAPVHDGEGNIVGSAVAIQDISDLKRAEQALRENEAQLQTILDNLSEGLVVATLDGQMFHWNRTSIEMHGFAGLEECRRRLPDFADIFELATMDGTVLPVDEWPLARILRGEKLRDLEIHIRRLDRAWQRIFSYGGALVRDAQGEPLLAVVSVRDITESMQGEQALRASEEALRQANEQLEEKVRERTAELVGLNENLVESRYQLRSLASDLILTEARERRALASELHDTVAQMLAIAKLTLEATGARLEGKSAAEVKKVVQLLQEASRQTRSLMADLSPSLLYEAGLGQALRALARRMGELHSLAIEVVDDGNPKPLGEDYRVVLFRAVQELLHNVVKHAKATKVKVSLQRAGKEVRIEVEDDGVGFLPTERGRGEGMREGFGLFSIQERLQHFGGSFEVVSRPGRGVRALIVAPLQVEEEGEVMEPAAVRILIAEDHRMMRDALATLLEKEPGFEVVGLAADGLEAVHLAREVKPDVVLMDVNMPRMDGIEATRQITAEFPRLKVIGLSVHAEHQIASQILAAGASSFVPKSSSPEELTEAIRTAVGIGKGN